MASPASHAPGADSLDVALGRRFAEGIVESAGVDPSVLDRAGTTLVPDEERAGTRVCLHYQLGQHVIIWFDPALGDHLDSMASDDAALDVDEFVATTTGFGWEALGQGIMRTLDERVDGPVDLPDGFTLERLDWANDAHTAAMQALVDVSAEDDLDEAEVEMDDLDDLAFAVVDGDLAEGGSIVAYGSSLPWDRGDGFGDIGVLTHHEARGRGLGALVVRAVMNQLHADGSESLYRHDPDNAGSKALSDRLGFVTRVVATAAQAPEASSSPGE